MVPVLWFQCIGSRVSCSTHLRIARHCASSACSEANACATFDTMQTTAEYYDINHSVMCIHTSLCKERTRQTTRTTWTHKTNEQTQSARCFDSGHQHASNQQTSTAPTRQEPKARLDKVRISVCSAASPHQPHDACGRAPPLHSEMNNHAHLLPSDSIKHFAP